MPWIEGPGGVQTYYYITIPVDLLAFLHSLQWDIFTWHIDVGTPIIRAIEWVLEWINSLVDWVQQIGNWYEDFRQEVVDFFTQIPKWLNEIWQWILNFADTLGDWIANWWEPIYQTVKDWVLTVIDEVKEALGVISDTVTRWVTTVESFFTSILPTLASKLDVADLIKAAFKPWTDLFNWWGEFYKEVKEFFVNPVEFIWNKFTDWFFGE